MAPTTGKQAPRRQDPSRREKTGKAAMINDPTLCVTQRQLELIALFASGYDYKAIAAAKFVSYSTVRQTLERARANVNADSYTHLTVLCQAHGLLVRDGNMFVPVVDPTDLS